MRGLSILSITSLVLAACGSGGESQAEETDNLPEPLASPEPEPSEVVSPVGQQSEEVTVPEGQSDPEVQTVSLEPRIPVFNAVCGNDIEVHANPGGPVFIDGERAELKKFNENYFEATRGATTVSISFRPDETLSLTFSGANRANGVCNPK